MAAHTGLTCPSVRACYYSKALDVLTELSLITKGQKLVFSDNPGIIYRESQNDVLRTARIFFNYLKYFIPHTDYYYRDLTYLEQSVKLITIICEPPKVLPNDQLCTLVVNVANALGGLEHLKQTYSADPISLKIVQRNYDALYASFSLLHEEAKQRSELHQEDYRVIL